MGFLAGKRFLITGVLSNRSIAYGIARACRREGAELAFSYQGERFRERVAGFAAEFGSTLLFDCDVAERRPDRRDCSPNSAKPGPSSTASSTRSASRRARRSRATSSTDCRASRSGSPTTSRATAFRRWPRRPLPHLRPGSSLLTLTYLGALRSVPNYNTMGLAKASLEASVRYLAANLGARGVRVNGISAGPIKTLAASGIKGFGKILDVVETTRRCAAT